MLFRSLQQPKLLKDKHVKCTLFSSGMLKPIMFFNRPELFEKLSDSVDKTFDVAAHVVKNEWNGNTSIELMGIDIRFPE